MSRPAAVHWTNRVKAILRTELKRRRVSYKQLADELEKMGIEESEKNIANKIARGRFTAVFFVQCLAAVGCKTVHLGEHNSSCDTVETAKP